MPYVLLGAWTRVPPPLHAIQRCVTYRNVFVPLTYRCLHPPRLPGFIIALKAARWQPCGRRPGVCWFCFADFAGTSCHAPAHSTVFVGCAAPRYLVNGWQGRRRGFMRIRHSRTGCSACSHPSPYANKLSRAFCRETYRAFALSRTKHCRVTLINGTRFHSHTVGCINTLLSWRAQPTSHACDRYLLTRAVRVTADLPTCNINAFWRAGDAAAA